MSTDEPRSSIAVSRTESITKESEPLRLIAPFELHIELSSDQCRTVVEALRDAIAVIEDRGAIVIRIG